MPEPSPVLLMCRDRYHFLPPEAADEDWVDVTRRLSLRRLLWALARHRETHPGDTLGFDELIAVGWPGERILLRAARNRLHVALSTLRRFGVQIEFHGQGWRLPPDIAVHWADLANEQAA